MLLPEPFQYALSSCQNTYVFACVLDTLSILFLLYSEKDGRGRAFATYTLQEVLDEPDVIECFTEPGRSPIQGEVLKTGTDLSENGSDAMAGSKATAKGIVM